MDGLTVKILKQIIIYGWPNSKNIKEALATILTQKIICFGNW